MSSHLLDIGGLITIRVVDASDHQLRRLRSSLSATDVATATPRFTVQFVDHLQHGPLHRQGLTDSGWGDDHFFLLDPSTGRAVIEAPFGHLDTEFVMMCDAGLRRVPLVKELVRLLLPGLSGLALHASAVKHDDEIIVPLGWANGGKTAATLAYLKHGATFVGDEWIGFGPGGDRTFGLGSSISIPQRLHGELAVPGGRTRHLRRAAGAALREVARSDRLRRASSRATQQLAIRTQARKLFPAIAPGETASAPHTFFIVQNSPGQPVSVAPIRSDAVAEMMSAVGRFERRHLYELYQAFQFAFPGRRDPVFEHIDGIETGLIHDLVADRAAYVVTHSHPGPLDPLFDAMQAARA